MNIAKDLPWDDNTTRAFLSSFLLRLQHVFIRGSVADQVNSRLRFSRFFPATERARQVLALDHVGAKPADFYSRGQVGELCCSREAVSCRGITMTRTESIAGRINSKGCSTRSTISIPLLSRSGDSHSSRGRYELARLIHRIAESAAR